MNQRVSVIPVKRKSDLKKVMSGMETAGSAVIINPLQANNAELAVETYFFNEALSSSVYPDSVPLVKIQRNGETVLVLTGGKVSKAVIENIAVAYYSSSSTSNFFIPVEIPFEHFYNNKNIYLYHGKTVKEVHLTCNRYEMESELLVKSARAGLKIDSIPVSTVYNGEDSYMHKVKDTYSFIKMYFMLMLIR